MHWCSMFSGTLLTFFAFDGKQGHFYSILNNSTLQVKMRMSEFGDPKLDVQGNLY